MFHTFDFCRDRGQIQKTKQKTKQNNKITTTKQNKNKKYTDAVFP